RHQNRLPDAQISRHLVFPSHDQGLDGGDAQAPGVTGDYLGVMAGLVPAFHASPRRGAANKTWMAATSAALTPYEDKLRRTPLETLRTCSKLRVPSPLPLADRAGGAEVNAIGRTWRCRRLLRLDWSGCAFLVLRRLRGTVSEGAYMAPPHRAGCRLQVRIV